MKAKYVLIILSMLFAVGCNRPDPNPELKDPIYLDIQRELQEAKREVDAQEKQLEEFKKAFASVVPQTGQIKFAQKRLNDATDKLQRQRQMVRYWEIRLDTRKAESKKLYQQAFSKDKPWPNQQEWQEYKTIRAAQTKPKLWSIDDRFKELGIQRKPLAPDKPKPESDAQRH